MHDVNGLHVALLPPKELGNVHQLHKARGKHGGAEPNVGMLLSGAGNDNQCPAHHAKAAVGKHFQVPPKHARVELGAPVVVKDDAARGAWPNKAHQQ